MKNKTATQERKQDFKTIKKEFPKGWIRLSVEKRFGKVGLEVLQFSTKLENFSAGKSAPNKAEMIFFEELIPVKK